MMHHTTWLLSSTEMELLPTGVLHCTKREFYLFRSCDLDLDPMTFICDHDLYPLLRRPKMNFLHQSFSKLLYYACTNIQTGVENGRYA